MNTKPGLNLLRAIATIAVIVIHLSSDAIVSHQKIGIDKWLPALFYSSFSRFCVPVFFMLSGALLLGKEESLSEFFKKRFSKIIPPFIFWSLVYIVYDACFVSRYKHSVYSILKLIPQKLLNGSQYHLWFIYVLLGLYLFIPIMSKWIKNATKKELNYFLIIWLITFLYYTPMLKAYLPKIDFTNFTGYFGYLVLGFYLWKYNFNRKYVAIIAVLAFLSILLGSYYTLNQHIKWSNDLFVQNLYYPVLIYSSSVFLLLKNVEVKSKLLKQGIELINQYSFGIYLVHVLVIKVLNKNGINWDIAHPVFSIPILLIVCLVLSTALSYLQQKLWRFN